MAGTDQAEAVRLANEAAAETLRLATEAAAETLRLATEAAAGDKAEALRLAGEMADTDQAEAVRLANEAAAETLRLAEEAAAETLRLATEAAADDKTEALRLAKVDADAALKVVQDELDVAKARILVIEEDAAGALAKVAKDERIARADGVHDAIGLDLGRTAAKRMPTEDSGVTVVSATRNAAGMVAVDVNDTADDDYAGGETNAGSSAWNNVMMTKTNSNEDTD